MRKPYDLGISFSGGGSRAAAFHLGTLRGLYDVGLLNKEIIEKNNVVLSTVSGGSVLGASWVASISNKKNVDEFLDNMKIELKKGFVGWKDIFGVLKAAFLPGYTRTNVLANNFDKIFFKGMKLADLPEKPKICINSTVLNNGQVGKFSKSGFSVIGVKAESVANFPLSLAVAASAAFPIFLPPVFLKKGKELPKNWGKDSNLHNHKRLALTDGGVLENLGIQTLLMGHTLPAWNIILSDAGSPLNLWKPGNPIERIKGLLMGLFSAPVLRRITTLMNDKQNRHMRLQLFKDMEKTWLIDGVRKRNVRIASEMKGYINQQPPYPKRKVLFIQISQNWHRFFGNISEWQLIALRRLYQKRTVLKPPPIPPRPHYSKIHELQNYSKLIEKFLIQVLDDSHRQYLERAKEVWSTLEAGIQVNDLKKISPNFTGLSEKKIDALHKHAYWQVLLSYALFW